MRVLCLDFTRCAVKVLFLIYSKVLGTLLQIKQKKSPNYDDRGGVVPSLIVLHYTDMHTAEEAVERLCDPEYQVSAHYVVDEDGRVLQLVEEQARAWHAGVSYWRGVSSLNAHSIGIELVNPGHRCGYRSFPVPQIESLIELCTVVGGRYDQEGIGGIGMEVLAHSDISPSRKKDPGELFPWKAVAAQGVGVWPVPDEIDIAAAQDMAGDEAAMHMLLKEYGYDPAASFEDVLVAYHRHYYPEKFLDGGDPAVMGPEGAARLLALLRIRHEGAKAL